MKGEAGTSVTVVSLPARRAGLEADGVRQATRVKAYRLLARILGAAVEALADHLRRYTATSPEAFVFLSSQGKGRRGPDGGTAQVRPSRVPQFRAAPR